MNPKIKICKTPPEVAEKIAAEIFKISEENSAKNRITNIALSGGNTPKILFKILSDDFSNRINWNKVNLFWADERCVAPTDDESNYGMTKKYLLDKIEIPEENIHRIIGENIPDKEASRYERELENNIITGGNDGPIFDLILLGIGIDGHTASIFPKYLELFNTQKLCAVTEHPESGQKRITLTGKVINNSKKIIFMITGNDKSEIVRIIIKKEADYQKFPSANVNPVNGIYEWYLDSEAAKYL